MNSLDSDEIFLKPCSMYNDPFRGEGSILVLCEAFTTNDKPAENNFRAACREVLLREDISAKHLEFEFDQYFSFANPSATELENHKLLLEVENILDAHFRACLYAGLKMSSCSIGIRPGGYSFIIGPSNGIRVGDNLMIARYILRRIAHHFGTYIDTHFFMRHVDTSTHQLILKISSRIMREHEGESMNDDESFLRKSKRISYFQFNKMGNELYNNFDFNCDPYKSITTIAELFTK